MNKNINPFVVHISSLGSRITIYPAKKAQIALLLAKKVTVSAKYLDFINVLLEKSLNVFSEQTGVNKHAIKLEEGKQLSYGPIYSLKPVKLKTLKIYIKTNLANGFIRTSKLPAGALILFVSKCNDSFYLYVNYLGFNNLTIKNWYLLPLIN